MCLSRKKREKTNRQTIFPLKKTPILLPNRTGSLNCTFWTQAITLLTFPNSTLIHLIGARAACSHTCPMVCHDIVIWEKHQTISHSRVINHNQTSNTILIQSWLSCSRRCYSETRVWVAGSRSTPESFSLPGLRCLYFNPEQLKHWSPECKNSRPDSFEFKWKI